MYGQVWQCITMFGGFCSKLALSPPTHWQLSQNQVKICNLAMRILTLMILMMRILTMILMMRIRMMMILMMKWWCWKSAKEEGMLQLVQMVLEKCWQAGKLGHSGEKQASKLGHSGEKVISDFREFATVKHTLVQWFYSPADWNGRAHTWQKEICLISCWTWVWYTLPCVNTRDEGNKTKGELHNNNIHLCGNQFKFESLLKIYWVFSLIIIIIINC